MVIITVNHKKIAESSDYTGTQTKVVLHIMMRTHMRQHESLEIEVYGSLLNNNRSLFVYYLTTITTGLLLSGYHHHYTLVLKNPDINPQHRCYSLLSHE